MFVNIGRVLLTCAALYGFVTKAEVEVEEVCHECEPPMETQDDVLLLQLKSGATLRGELVEQASSNTSRSKAVEPPPVTIVEVPNWIAPAVPESYATEYKGLIYTSLLLGQDLMTGQLVEGGVLQEMERIFSNLMLILAETGKTVDDVVKLFVVLRNVSEEKETLEHLYHAHFPIPRLRYVMESPLPNGANLGIQYIISGEDQKMFADPFTPNRKDVSFSDLSGSMIYASGFVGYNPADPAHMIVSPDPTAQMKQAFANVETALKEAGGTIQSATDCQLWVNSWSILPAVMSVYTSSFQNGDYPALTTSQVDGFVKSAGNVGVMCRAAAPGVEVKRVKGTGDESSVTVAGDLAYTSGFYAPQTAGVPADTQMAMDQVKAALEAAGSNMDRVLFCQVTVADLSNVPAIDGVYRLYFKEKFPARQVMKVVSPSPSGGATVSIGCIGSLA